MTDLELAKKAYEIYKNYLQIKVNFEQLSKEEKYAWILVVIEIQDILKRNQMTDEHFKKINERISEIKFEAEQYKEKTSSLTLNEYQNQAVSTAIYKDTELYAAHPFSGQLYCALQLAAESGEIAAKYAKNLRKGGIEPINKDQIKLELGDVLWYVSALANELEFTLEEIAQMNIEKLQDRINRGVIHGSGDNR